MLFYNLFFTQTWYDPEKSFFADDILSGTCRQSARFSLLFCSFVCYLWVWSCNFKWCFFAFLYLLKKPSMLFITVYMRVEVLRYVIQAVGFVLEVFWMFETSLDVSCIFKYFLLFFCRDSTLSFASSFGAELSTLHQGQVQSTFNLWPLIENLWQLKNVIWFWIGWIFTLFLRKEIDFCLHVFYLDKTIKT